MKRILLISFIFFAFSCKTAKNVSNSDTNTVKIVEKEVVKYAFDSILIEKTDTFRQYLRGDTVVMESVRWRNKVRAQIKIDTLVRNDTLFIEKQVIKSEVVIQKLPFWKRAWFAWALMAISFVAWVIFRLYIRIK